MDVYVHFSYFSMGSVIQFCTLSVIFLSKVAKLPRENDEFYHFCYVSASDRRVRGVSTPFQFVSDRQNEWELLEPPTTNGEPAEHHTVQQQKQQVAESCLLSHLNRHRHTLLTAIFARLTSCRPWFSSSSHPYPEHPHRLKLFVSTFWASGLYFAYLH